MANLEGVEWVHVGPVSAVGESGYAVFPVRNHRVLVCRVGDLFHGIEDRCAHAGMALNGGTLRGTRFMCPVHGAEFDVVTGAHLCPPALRAVRCFDVRVVADQIEVAAHPRRSAEAPRPSGWPLGF